MTIADNYLPVVTQGNGVTVDFSANWNAISEDYVRVWLQLISTGALTALVLDVDFTLGVINPSGFTATLTVAPSNLYNVILGRDISQAQSNPYSTAKGFQGSVQESSFDQAMGAIQDLQEQVDRSLLFQVGSTARGVILAQPSAGKALLWNSTEDGIINSDDDFNDIVADATTQANNAANSANSAADSAAEAALQAAQFSGTSSTSITIATGAKVFVTQADKLFNGENVRVYSDADPTNFMDGLATYSGTSLSVDVVVIGGTGTFTDWIIKVNGARGATGATGTIGVNSVENTMLAKMPLRTIKSNKEGTEQDANDNTLSDFLDAVITNLQGTIIVRSSTGWTGLGAGAAGQFLKTLGAGADPIWASLISSLPSARYTYQVASGLGSGSFTAGAWTDRPLNTEVYDTIGISLASNQLALPAGTYEVFANAVAMSSNFNNNNLRLRLYNVTDAAAIAGCISNTVYATTSGSAQYPATLNGVKFTLATAKTISMQYYCATTAASTANTTGEDEVYADLFIRKIA